MLFGKLLLSREGNRISVSRLTPNDISFPLLAAFARWQVIHLTTVMRYKN